VSDEQPDYWRLISVLFSTLPLTPKLALHLHRSAYELYRTDGGVAELTGDSGVIVSGAVRNLKQEVALGAFAGPTFEAHIETERGAGIVRFLLTHQGIELMTQQAARPASLMN
jgi:hypothetical protein